MRFFIILNPAAGRGRGAGARHVIQRTLAAAGADFDIVETTGRGHAVELARQVTPGRYETVVAVGGDGTAHEVVAGLVAAAQASGSWREGKPCGPFGVVPVGTGNDYAWRLGVPENNPQAACELLLSGHRRVVDLGQVVDEQGRTEVFHNHLGGGFEAATAIESQKVGRLRGLLLYLVAVLRVIPQYSKGRLTTVRYHGREQTPGDPTLGEQMLRVETLRVETRRILLASVANGGRTGGGFRIAPGARLDDGQLDLVLADSPNVPTILYLLLHFLAGTHVHQKRFVALDRTDHVVIEAPDGIPVHLDGEIFRSDARRLDVSVLPGRLEVIAPQERAAA